MASLGRRGGVLFLSRRLNGDLTSSHRSTQSQTARRDKSAYGFGQQWTGALSRGADGLFVEEAPELKPDEIQQFGLRQEMVPLLGLEGDERVIDASAGWGHSVVVVQQNGGTKTKLKVCGRPHDFQTLLRLRRLPDVVQNFCIQHTMNDTLSPSIFQSIASYLVGENEVTQNEEAYRQYSNMPTLLELRLPFGECPALSGDCVPKRATDQNDESTDAGPLHRTFHNTIATSAGLTAVISNTGSLYTFGLNHRGQCGTGEFGPNVWRPTQVRGLGSIRSILDHGAPSDNLFKDFQKQQHPIVSVALGLQHGIALDSAGQVFCWGKGERGQLGLGRRFASEDNDAASQDVEEEPNQNRTFEYALKVAHFYDPTKSATKNDTYAPVLSEEDSRIRLVAAGMNFCFAVTESNLPYIWGKSILPNPNYSQDGLNVRTSPVQDSTYPRFVPGLPPGLRVEKVACGSHHAAMLLEDGSIFCVGVATDKPVPMWGEAVEILQPGLIEMERLVSFTAGFDRTTAVYQTEDGRRQVIESQLWSTEEMRLQSAVRPSFMDWVETERAEEKVHSVHRGWLHSIVVTE
ncbi:hypothetical protein THAOC_19855 [Thalassiosira oceanica]|uniref:Uncharacterized protein n=1 Tax=Thalassiosira oceanica TaxID=159749 RepID=K0SFZ8_THAOC|nr:hypothetical protein THAOC_19855 [Thalassiosira oceanica]|eukprot:EJK59866.1 hypothetical protein THAOC_19855 [Thalassiosira oceanica]